MKPNFSNMYNSLTSSRSHPNRSLQLSYTIPPPPSFLAPDHPPSPFLLDSPAPPIPPPFVPSPSPEPLPPVFVPDSFYSDKPDPPLLSERNCLPYQPQLNEPWPSVRPKRAYTEGSHPSSDFSCLCEQLTQSQNQKSQLIQSITHFENYIARYPQYERGFDFNQDKCLDNAERKLKKTKILLEKNKCQISILESQIPPKKGFPIYYPLPIPPQDTEKNRSSKKNTKFFKIFKKRAKTWPYS